MPKIEQILAQVEDLLTTVKPQEAEDRLRSLIQTIGDDELRTWEPDLRITIDHFFPKRQKALSKTLDQRLLGPDDSDSGLLKLHEAEPEPVLDFESLRGEFADDLKDLSDHRIYQWSTFYRDTLSVYFDRFVQTAATEKARTESLRVMREGLASHSQEIVEKGFRYLISTSRETRHYAVTKSLNGLQRFLDLPIEFFSAKDAMVRTEDAQQLRAVCSGMLRGILEGYARAQFRDLSGSELLPRYPRAWAHSLAFFIDYDLSPLVDELEPGEFRDGLTRSVQPLIQALDELGAKTGDYVPLAALAQLNWDARRLDASIQPPPYAAEPQLIDIQCYLDGSFVSRRDLEEAANRNIALIIAPLRPDLRALVTRANA